MIFKTAYNSRDVESPTRYEVNNLPSMTIPDQTMTIREMLTRHTQGLGLRGQKVPIYEGTESPFQGKDPRTLDLSEIADMRDEAIEREKTKLTKAQERKKQDAEQKRQADIKKAAEELNKAAKQPTNDGEQPS